MLTINGTGVTVYGAANPNPLPVDSGWAEQTELVPCSYQVVKWVTVMFLPIVPLGVFRVVRARRTFWSFQAANYMMQPVAWDWRQVLTHYAVGWCAPLVIIAMIGAHEWLKKSNSSLAMQLELPMLGVVIFAFLCASVILLKMLFASEPPDNFIPPQSERPFAPANATTDIRYQESPFSSPATEANKTATTPMVSTLFVEEATGHRAAGQVNTPQASAGMTFEAAKSPPVVVTTPFGPATPPQTKPSGTNSVLAVTVAMLILLVSGVTFLACAGVAYSIVARPNNVNYDFPDSPTGLPAADPAVVASSGKRVAVGDELAIGNELQGEWAGEWYRARVLAVLPDGRVRIRWLDWGPAFDEIVQRNRLQYAE